MGTRKRFLGTHGRTRQSKVRRCFLRMASAVVKQCGLTAITRFNMIRTVMSREKSIKPNAAVLRSSSRSKSPRSHIVTE